MNELDWEYIIDVLDKATAGATGCSPTLFDASNALQKLQNEFDQPLDEVERQKCIGALENFHTHSGILHDLGFLEVWAPRDFFARWGGAVGSSTAMCIGRSGSQHQVTFFWRT